MLGASCSPCCGGCFCVQLSFEAAGTPLAALDGQVIYQIVPEIEGPGLVPDTQRFFAYGQRPSPEYFLFSAWYVTARRTFANIDGVYTRINTIEYPGGFACPAAVFSQISPADSEPFIDTSLGDHVFRHSSGATVTLKRACCNTTPVPYKFNGVVQQYPSSITVRLTPTKVTGPSSYFDIPIEFITRTVSLVRNSSGSYVWSFVPNTDKYATGDILTLTMPELLCRDSERWYPQLFMNRCVPLVRWNYPSDVDAVVASYDPFRLGRFFSYNGETYLNWQPTVPDGAFNGSIQSSVSYADVMCEPSGGRVFDLDPVLPFTLFDTAAGVKSFPILQDWPEYLAINNAIPSEITYKNVVFAYGSQPFTMTIKAEILSCE